MRRIIVEKRKNLNEDLKNRESNIELLRIIAMLMIVAHHFSIHGKFEVENTLFINNIWLHFLSSGGKIGVNVFVMISGYFLISSKKVKTKRFFKLLAQIFFYSLITFLLFVCLGLVPFNLSDMIKYFLGYPMWWFAKSYLVLYLIHPYINKLLNNLNKKEYKKLILLSTFLWSLIPTIFIFPLDDGTLIWLIYVYMLGGYLKKYPLNIKCNISKYFLILYIFTFLSVIIFNFIGLKISFVAQHATYFFGIEKIFTLFISLFLFLSFYNLKIKYNKIINIISSTTFGIYLIHDNDYMRKFLWVTLFNNAGYSNTYMLIPYSICVIIIVFIICSLIELIRIYTFEKRYMKLIEILSKTFEKGIDKLLNFKYFDKI